MKNRLKTIISILLVFLIPMALILTPVTPENAVRLKLLSTGYIVNVLGSTIQPSQDIGPYQHCTYFCDGIMAGSKHGYRVRKVPSSPWYVADQI